MAEFEKKNVGLALKSVGGTSGSEGKVQGYGSVFGNIDSYGDIVAPGAFAASLSERGSRPIPALWQHNPDQPIGGWSAKEDAIGLECDGELEIDDDPIAKKAFVYAKKGIVTGLSIGFYTRDASFDEKTGLRTLKKVDLEEVSLVTFPANTSAQVTGTKRSGAIGAVLQRKFAAKGVPSVDELAELFRDLGCEAELATAIAAEGIKSRQPRNVSDLIADIRSILGS